MRLSIVAIGTLLFAAVLLAASGGDAQARRKDPFAGLRASLNDLFAPPRRSRRAKAKHVRTPAKDTAVKETPPAPPKAPAAADKKVRPAERPARAPAAAEKPPQRAVSRPQIEPRPAEPDRRPASPQAREQAKSALPPPTKRAFRDPPKDAAVNANRPASPGPLQQGEAKRQEERVAALPPPTKRAYGDPQKPPAEPETAETAPPPPPSACQLRLASGEANAVATIQPRVSVGQCMVDDVVRLEAVMAVDGRRIAIAPPAILRCPMAETVVQWLRDDVAPVARELGAGLKSVSADTSFECRSRNHIAGAKLSEHGHANAIDLRGVTLADGTVFRFTDAAADRAAREALRKSACARFTTVLGPGSDGYHETHIHLDLVQRRGGYRLCQWDVRDPAVAVTPLPPERPSSAPPRSPHARR